ncbi:MAG TPA: tRNA (adenosine(37)-N6)-dimethylallyltransferase MiaA [Candidatus Omnitrophota bacterium]|nr:tRNA (adenosine(37)-N6)-dimethylallyltransferase MiaA [Candidatus Omnitrophota bacterium]
MLTSPVVLLIVGPTASGKTSLSIELAKRLGGEIISADSMLVYKGMDIGTAKPSLKERLKIPHHGIDLVEPTRKFSVFQYRQFALKTIRDVVSRGKVPIVVGGTGFYVRALLEGLSPLPGADAKIRKQLERELKQEGPERLYKRLLKIDPKRARDIGPHNVRRVMRALEIYLVSGRKPSLPAAPSPGLRELGYCPVVIGLNRDRAFLYEEINRRVERMFRKGLLAEIKKLSKKRLSETARQGVGYKEILADALKTSGLAAEWERRARTQGRDRIKRATRRFAKRQWTWFKKEKGIRWVWWPEGLPTQAVAEFVQNSMLGPLS